MAHADSSADIQILQTGTYMAVYTGTAQPGIGATVPTSNNLSFTLNGTTLVGADAAHVFTTTGETSPQTLALIFNVTAAPSVLRVISNGGNFIYSNFSVNIFKIGGE